MSEEVRRPLVHLKDPQQSRERRDGRRAKADLSPLVWGGKMTPTQLPRSPICDEPGVDQRHRRNGS